MGSIKMCVRTVEGEDGFMRNISGIDVNVLRTISGEDLGECRNISGINAGGTPQALLGTKPTITEITGADTSYTTPPGCLYVEVYVIGIAGDGGQGTTTTNREQGGGGGGGGVSVGFYPAGTYTVDNSPRAFDILSTTAGAAGQRPVTAGVTYSGGLSGTAVNSVYPIGVIAATPPGQLGGNGGGSFVAGQIGLGWQSDTLLHDGEPGFMGCGGGGGTNDGNGGPGSQGLIRIIEYY
jgi:hypothetical protein